MDPFIMNQLSDIGLIGYRGKLLEHIPANKKKKKEWIAQWNHLQKLAEALRTEPKDLQPKSGIDIEIYPWRNQCNSSLILAWRDHIYKNSQIDSTDLELANEFSFSQDLFAKR